MVKEGIICKLDSRFLTTFNMSCNFCYFETTYFYKYKPFQNKLRWFFLLSIVFNYHISFLIRRYYHIFFQSFQDKLILETKKKCVYECWVESKIINIKIGIFGWGFIKQNVITVYINYWFDLIKLKIVILLFKRLVGEISTRRTSV